MILIKVQQSGSVGKMSESDDRHTDERMADLADLILALARTITTESLLDEQVVELTATEINVMRFVDRHPGTSPTEVAAATGLQRSNLSRALRTLEAKGLVKRSTGRGDARQAQLNPTRRAEANLRRLRANWSRLLGNAGADPRNLDSTLRMLAELEAGLAATGLAQLESRCSPGLASAIADPTTTAQGAPTPAARNSAAQPRGAAGRRTATAGGAPAPPTPAPA
jgi:DNA-binding MarR family transcriptional regulator